MTVTIDRFLTNHGFEHEELTVIRHRAFLYQGILASGMLALTFFALAIGAWT